MKKYTKNEIESELNELNNGCEPPWIIEDGKLNKTFMFKNFIDAFGFMTKFAIHAEKADHHPEWCNVYDKVTINLITHEADGLTKRDFDLAKIADEINT